MNRPPRITEAEWEVMRVFWAASAAGATATAGATPALTASDVLERLGRSPAPGQPGRPGWKPTTVKTLISRLVKKNALGFRESGRVYYYYPLVTREECVRAESRSFLQRVYGGAVQPMLVSFIRESKLTSEELDELRRLLDERVK